ncbi:g2267 [Coccomyxa viridis]|uniref:G2267 protein n=1 Tax=Coccomyxa viridis TaxID=1274662 RepID=A0ABP1FQE4_9CHLO
MPKTAVPLQKCCADVHSTPTEALPWLEAIRQHTSDLLKLVEDDEVSTDERSAIIARLAVYDKALDLAKQADLPHEQRFQMCRQIILTFHEKARNCLESRPKDALSLLHCAYQLTTEHLLQKLELDEKDPGFETFQRVLRLRSQAHLLNDQAADAHTDLQRARLLQAPDADSPSLCLTAMAALLQLKKPEQADAELLALVLHKDASAALCLEALSAALKAPCCSALKPSAGIVLERFADDATVPLRLVQALLSASKEDTCEDSKALALEISRSKKRLELFRKVDDSTKDQRKSMHELLWNHATQHITTKDYRTCIECYTAALAYAEADAKPATAHQLARAHLAVQRLDRSLESPNIAAEQEPSSQQSSSTERQVLLMQGEARKELNRLRPLMNCKKTSSEHLKALLQEVYSGNTPPRMATAKAALTMLWEDTIAVQIPKMEEGYGPQQTDREASSAAEDGSNSNAKEEEDAEDHSSLDDDDSDDVISQGSIHHRLAALFDQARERLALVGKDSFFGALPPEYFVASASPAAVAAYEASIPLAAAVIFRASGSFWDAMPTRTPQEELKRLNAYVLGARTALEEWIEHPKCVSTLSLPRILHEKASAAMEAATQLPLDPEALEQHKTFLCTIGKHMALRLREYGHLMLPFIEQSKAEGRFKAEEWVSFGYACLAVPPTPLMPAAKAAWRAGMQLMRSSGEPPDVDTYAQAVRCLYEVSSEEEALTLLAETSDFVRSMETPSYPSRHLKDLIRTAWERGCKQAEAQRHSKARAFMAAALNLMDFCDGYKNSKEVYSRVFANMLQEAMP